MYDNNMVTVPITDYFKFFMEKYKIPIGGDAYTSIVESLISLAKQTTYDISGSRQEEEMREIANIIHQYKLNIIMDTEFIAMLENVSKELITYLVVNDQLDKVIYLVSHTNNYNVFNSYRL